jgi:hypothetical protein
MAQEGAIDIEMLDEFGEYLSFTSATVDAVVSINLVATRVTRLRGKVSSDVKRSSGYRVRAWSGLRSVCLIRYRIQGRSSSRSIYATHVQRRC